MSKVFRVGAVAAALATASGAQAEIFPEFSGARFQINRQRVVTGTLKSCAKSETYLVPTVYLYVSARTKVSAGGGLGNAGTKARVFVDLPPKAELQDMAREFQDQIVGQLRAAGFKVLTFDDIKGDVAGRSLMSPNPRYGMPTNGLRNLPGIDFVIAAPSDAQTLDYNWITGPTKNFGDAAARTGATQLVTEVELAMPDLSASASKNEGLTWKSSSAKITYVPTLRFAGATVYGLTAKGAWCSIGVPEMGFRPVAIKVGDIRDGRVTTNDYGDWGTKSGDYAFMVDDAAFRAGVAVGAKELGRLVADAMSGKDVKK